MSEKHLKDHREIGRRLDLFSFHKYAPGAIFWHPKGWIIYQTLVNFIRKRSKAEGYLEISTPVMVKSLLYKNSGHWQHFGENIFNLKVDGEDYSLKPMNCPESTIIYGSKIRSYNDLPIKLSEFGILHRKELSGVLGGALRVRQFVIDDAHLFVRPDQIQQEIHKLLILTIEVYKSLNFKPRFYLATRPDKAMGDEITWKQAESDLEKALKKAKVKYDIKPKDGAFYGPKIDIHIKDSQDRDWQLATIQLDFQIPKSMRLTYVDKDGSKKEPVMIHQGIFGSLERFIGIITEHFQGAFPVWLSPIQVIVVPISDKFTDYAQKVASDIISNSIRCEVNIRNNTLPAKIRDATLQKIPYICVVGQKEANSNKVSVRKLTGENLGGIQNKKFIQRIKNEIANKT
ncbi:threonine--tRNA ligase [Candidatus Curtissbacteria bacterium RIFCSPHIGHO2_12_FULL_38_9b]|uniref:Threonine--tRNA ligase n=1 Tax=Candidatus Curtissbacteria bacterium RIFCSPHIGHO2_12_FULL_38_9b TaxID=1797720 RepID=A0A1F5GZ15_9BACT|nr:MAG: threonine--tRNA ligase [Candidatus Curtissbacteria bacterium RIFCSPHIGHO2_12_FULL_38_9b]